MEEFRSETAKVLSSFKDG